MHVPSPGEGVRNARAKDARDSESGMHEYSILLSTARGEICPARTRAGYPG